MIATYGYGTENDFALIFDPENKIEISAEQVVRICDRSSGIPSLRGHGCDGLIRITKIDGKWFMDYRNNDGSTAVCAAAFTITSG